MTNDNGPSGSARLKQEAAVLGRALTKALAGLPAALSTPEVPHGVAARLGLGPGDVETRGSGFGIRESGPTPDFRLPTPGFSVSETALRKVETALVELDGCKQQAQIEDSLIGNCK